LPDCVPGDPDVHRNVIEFRSHGMVREEDRLRRHEGPWYHEMHGLGFNYRLSLARMSLSAAGLCRAVGSTRVVLGR